MGTNSTLANEGQDGLPSSETLLHHPQIPGPGCRGPAQYMGYGYCAQNNLVYILQE